MSGDLTGLCLYMSPNSPYEKQILLLFSHELTELNPKVSMTDAKLYTRRIGVACNPNLALINHACDPNYGRVWIHSGPGNCCIFWPENRCFALQLIVETLSFFAIFCGFPYYNCFASWALFWGRWFKVGSMCTYSVFWLVRSYVSARTTCSL